MILTVFLVVLNSTKISVRDKVGFKIYSSKVFYNFILNYLLNLKSKSLYEQKLLFNTINFFRSLFIKCKIYNWNLKWSLK